MSDHAVRAQEILDAAIKSADAIAAMLNEPLTGLPRDRVVEIDSRRLDAEARLTSVDRLHAAAQVHASLAMADQIRIANLIALHKIKGVSEAFDFASPVIAYDPTRGYYLRPAIAEALGLS